jgi:hypothetical protein
MQSHRFAITTFFALTCCLASGQSVQRSDDVASMSGTASMFPNGSGAYTTVVFTSNTPISDASNQIVYVLQEENALLPPSWSGPARILTGDGFLAVVPDHGSGQKWLLKFSDRPVPSSLAKQGFRVFDIFGIARYGDKAALTVDQVSCLASTGRNCEPAPQP